MGDKPKSIQEKVTIRPTPLGARVIQRLGIPHMDKSGELRRLLELGFAAELAGFSLDGTVLRHGGRVWDLRSELEQNFARGHESAMPPQASASSGSETASAATDPKAVATLAVDQQPSAVPDSHNVVKPEAHQESPLLTNLRGLAGGS
jgi:hypothetical protein